MIKEILAYPNKKLREVSSEVTEFNDELHQLLDDLYETMIATEGLGLASIQIGVAKRVLIIKIPDNDDFNSDPLVNPYYTDHTDTLYEIINPKIVEHSGSISLYEACLSVPGFNEKVKRFKKIKLEYQDRNGKNIELTIDDFLSIAIQHEMDHIDGILFIDKLSILKRKKFEKLYNRNN